MSVIALRRRSRRAPPMLTPAQLARIVAATATLPHDQRQAFTLRLASRLKRLPGSFANDTALSAAIDNTLADVIGSTS